MPSIAGRPSHVHFGVVTPTHVNLQWEAPVDSNGKITRYGIRYWRADQSDAEVGGGPRASQKTRATLQATATTTSHTLYEFSANGLSPNTTYFFAIKAETAVGWGHEVEASVYTSALRRPPPSPAAPEPNAMRAPSPFGIWLRWTPPQRRARATDEAPVRAIEVEYHRANEDWTLLPLSLMPDKNEFYLDG